MGEDWYVAIPEIQALIPVGRHFPDMDWVACEFKSFNDFCDRLDAAEYDVDIDKKLKDFTINDISKLVKLYKDITGIALDITNIIYISKLMQTFPAAVLVSCYQEEEMKKYKSYKRF